ncbi:MAG: UDP-glucose 4-epimerase GalE [Clostridiales bacterium]|jgi:UDP-glucose 4-epimerase|nr:UDP-glucose 4-epimerase GalE [Clostridiales bacterium]
MAVLVTGGAGYIGSHTCLELIAQGYNVVAVDNFCNSQPESITRVKELAGKSFPFYEIDVRDESALDEIFKNHDTDCIIHFAGLKAVGESVKVPLMYYNNNLLSTIALCSAMKKYNVKRLIFSSSATVYNGANEMPLTEKSLTGGCTNPYGWTKFMCEQILRDTAQSEQDWSIILLRYFNPIGAHISGMIGEDPSDTPNNLMPYISQTAIGRLKCLSVYGGDYPTNDGTGVRDYIHVDDLAKGHVSAIKYSTAHTGTEVFNLGSGVGTSVLGLITAFETASGVKIPYEIAGRRPGDIAVCYASAEKAAEILNWRAEKSIAEACADTWRWQSLNPYGFKNKL